MLIRISHEKASDSSNWNITSEQLLTGYLFQCKNEKFDKKLLSKEK